MGTKYNWKFWKFWIEFSPTIFIRINKHTKYGWKTIFQLEINI